MTVTQPRSEMYFDEFKHQLPDIDEQETIDWIRSLDDVVDQEGETRARFLLFKLLKRARQLQVGLPPLTNTRYINTISPEQEPEFPGDEQLERRIRRLIRWNAVAMVLRGQQPLRRARRPPGHVRERRHALRGRLQLVLQGPRERRAGRPDLLPGPRRAGHLRPRLPRGPDHRGAARPLPARDAAAEGPVVVPAPPPHARLLGVPDGLDGPRARSTRSTRRGSTATSRTAASSTRRARASGRSSATARPTSPRRSARSRSRRARASTT